MSMAMSGPDSKTGNKPFHSVYDKTHEDKKVHKLTICLSKYNRIFLTWTSHNQTGFLVFLRYGLTDNNLPGQDKRHIELL